MNKKPKMKNSKAVEDIVMVYRFLSKEEQAAVKYGIGYIEPPEIPDPIPIKAFIPKEVPPCKKNGHKYKDVGIVKNWFSPPETKMVCSQCGDVIYT